MAYHIAVFFTETTIAPVKFILYIRTYMDNIGSALTLARGISIIVLLTLIISFSLQTNTYADAKPWSLDNALDTPEWLSISGSTQRIRSIRR